MSAERGADGVVRRFQTSVAAGLAIIGGVVIFGALMLLIASLFRDLPEQAQVAADDTSGEVVFTLRDAQQLEGTRLIRIDVVASTGEAQPYSSSASDDHRNIVLVDKSTGASRRLLPDNQRRIAQSHLLPAAPSAPSPAETDPMLDAPQSASRPAPAAYFVLATEQAADARMQDVVVGSLSDERRAVAMRGIDGIQAVWMEAPDLLGLLVRERLALYHRIFDLRALKVISSRKIDVGS